MNVEFGKNILSIFNIFGYFTYELIFFLCFVRSFLEQCFFELKGLAQLPGVLLTKKRFFLI